MRFLLLLAVLISGCGQLVTVVGPGQPVLLVKPVTLPAGSFAALKGVDANGNPTWAVSSSAGTAPAGSIVEPLPAAKAAK